MMMCLFYVYLTDNYILNRFSCFVMNVFRLSFKRAIAARDSISNHYLEEIT